MSDESDAALVQRAQKGNVNAVGELYDRHHIRIFRYLWSRLHDKQLAEDLTGEVFVRMVAHLPGYRPTSIPFKAWLYRIAHNLMVDQYREQSSHPLEPLERAEGLDGERQNPAAAAEWQLNAEQVEHALRALDPAQQEVVVLRFLVGLSLQEVALALSKSVAAIKSLQHRGLAALRVSLQDN